MKRILFFLMAVAYSVVLQAAKAHPGPFTVTQSDGTQVTVKIHGDEDFHYYTTLDGVILFRDGNDYFVASISDNGEIVSSGQLAHNASDRSTEEINIVSKQTKTKFFASVAKKMNKAKANRTALVEDNKTLFPHMGNPKVLVALVQFSDVKFSVNDPKKAFDQYLNAQRGEIENLGNYNTRNAGSVAQYFDDASFGKFRPQFEVLDPITLDNTLVHYGEGKNDKMSLLIPDVCKAIDENINFKDYDQNNDGKVDLIYIIYAGYSASWGNNSTDCIWPKSGTGSFGTYDGKSVYRYGVSNELNYTPDYSVNGEKKNVINGIGLFCHEFSHCMGMPDLYTTDAAPEETQNANNQEMEYWSIMDIGTYLVDGHIPNAYTAWEREFFGWMEIEDITDADAQVIEMKAIDKGGKAYRIRNTNDESGNEYYVLENIQNYGWNTSQLGHGMLAMHVDYDANIFSLASNSVNNVLDHPRMTVLAADGLLLNYASVKDKETYNIFKEQAAGDPFPGTSEVTSLTDETTVKPIIYTGANLNKPIYDIKETNGVITFKYLDPTVTSIKDAIVEKKHKDNKIYTLDGRYIGTNADGLNKGIYIIGNKKVVIK